MRSGRLASYALALLLVSCRKNEEPATPIADASVDASVDAAAEEEGIKPVYPLDAGPPDLLALKLCEALHDLPAKRKADCCKQPVGTVLTSECVRMLTGALSSHAVTLSAVDVDRCAAAMDAVYQGCDWPGPNTPDVPEACLGIVKGTLHARARCRSSLECSGEQRCNGVGPTQAGTCGPTREDGEPCNVSTDALAGVVLQNGVIDKLHPECTGYCNRNRCAHYGKAGASCGVTERCEVGTLCKDGKCATAAPAKLGQDCPAGLCEGGARCYFGKCVTRQPAGSKCTQHVECVGGCIKKGDAGAGVCGPKCTVY
jgi:hypothetical protein